MPSCNTYNLVQHIPTPALAVWHTQKRGNCSCPACCNALRPRVHNAPAKWCISTQVCASLPTPCKGEQKAQRGCISPVPQGRWLGWLGLLHPAGLQGLPNGSPASPNGCYEPLSSLPGFLKSPVPPQRQWLRPLRGGVSLHPGPAAPHQQRLCVCVLCMCVFSGLPAQGRALRYWPAVPTVAARLQRATTVAALRAPWLAVPANRCAGIARPSRGSRSPGWRRNSTGRTTYPGHGDASWLPP